VEGGPGLTRLALADAAVDAPAAVRVDQRVAAALEGLQLPAEQLPVESDQRRVVRPADLEVHYRVPHRRLPRPPAAALTCLFSNPADPFTPPGSHPADASSRVGHSLPRERRLAMGQGASGDDGSSAPRSGAAAAGGSAGPGSLGSGVEYGCVAPGPGAAGGGAAGGGSAGGGSAGGGAAGGGAVGGGAAGVGAGGGGIVESAGG